MNMRFKKFALVLAIVLMAGTLTSALASPFADVPADHWAYDAVVELAAAGLIEGYPDGTYGGARMMTRYEAAMVFARALQRLESQIAANNLLPELDRIKAELMAEIEAAKAAAAAAAEKNQSRPQLWRRLVVTRTWIQKPWPASAPMRSPTKLSQATWPISKLECSASSTAFATTSTS